MRTPNPFMIADLTRLWARTSDISLGAPEVIARRLHLLQPATLWSPASLLEMQRMVLEKTTAAAEAGWAIWLAALAPFGWATPAAVPWWGSSHQQRLASHAVRSAHRALAPVSRRVKANVKRLRPR